MLVTEAPRWILDLIGYFTVLGTVDRLRYHHPALLNSLAEVKHLGTVPCGAHLSLNVSSQESSAGFSNAGKFALLRTLPCGDLGPEGVGIQLSGKLSALFPCEHELRISVKETCLFCYPQSLVVV